MKRLLPFLTLTLMLSGCGLRPVYSGGTRGSVAQALSNVEVAPIEGKAGWLVRTALEDRLAHDEAAPAYRLVIKLDDDIQGFGVRADDAITRERRTLRARYQLVDVATGAQMIDATASSDAGIDVVSSEYATIAAEDTALERLSKTIADQIISRLALFAIQGGDPTPPTQAPATAATSPVAPTQAK